MHELFHVKPFRLRPRSDFALYTKSRMISGESRRPPLIPGRISAARVMRRRHLRQAWRWHPHNDTLAGEERARLHFSFTFAGAERKITGSHYARHVGSFMSLSPGPSTFAISSRNVLHDPLPLRLLHATSSIRSRLLPPCSPPALGERPREKKILFIS